MKILFLSDDFPPKSVGGADRVAFDLAKEVQSAGHSVFVLTTVQNKQDEGESELEGIKVFRIYSNYKVHWRAYLSLYNPQTVGQTGKIIQTIQPDVVHVHNIHRYLSYHCLKLAKQSGARVFLTAHDTMLFHYGKFTEVKQFSKFGGDYQISGWKIFVRYGFRYNPFRNLIIRNYLKFVDRIFAVSTALKEALNQNRIGNVEVVFNGIDVERWTFNFETVAQFRQKHDLIHRKAILFGGRLSGLKGGIRILEAMTLIVKQVPEAVILVLGKSNKFAEEMETFSAEYQIAQNVVFTGWLSGDELKAAYHAAEVVVTPSIYFDPFNLFNIEAMACHKPVVGTFFGGTPEIIEDGRTGYIVDPNDIEDLARKIVYLIKNPQIAKMFGEAGYKRVNSEFSLKKQLQRYLEFYQS